jgi:hypothetical protein
VIGNIWSKRMEQQKQADGSGHARHRRAGLQTADNRLKLEIPSDVSFDTNRSDIKPNFQPVLDRFATTLQETRPLSSPSSATPTAPAATASTSRCRSTARRMRAITWRARRSRQPDHGRRARVARSDRVE